jgi:hypothetical protein
MLQTGFTELLGLATQEILLVQELQVQVDQQEDYPQATDAEAMLGLEITLPALLQTQVETDL